MTTIVYRDGVMCGDTAVFDRGVYCGEMEKIHRNKDGWLCGLAGAISELIQIREWFLGGMEGIPPEIKADQSEVIFVSPDGVVSWMGSGQDRTQIDGKFFAIGSGFSLAMGAMAAGADAQEAIRIAADLDCMTRRPLMSLILSEYNE